MLFFRIAIALSFFWGIFSGSFAFAAEEETQYSLAAACVQEAGMTYNTAVMICLNELGKKYEAGLVSAEEHANESAYCAQGPLFEAYQRGMAVCYQTHSFGSVWDLPIMKQALTSQFENYGSMTSDQSARLGECVGGLSSSYNLQEPSSDVQHAIADCFAQGGLGGAKELYEKAGIALDCAKEAGKVNNISDIRSLIARNNPEDEAFVKECVIKRTTPVIAAIAVANVPLAVGFHNTFVFAQFLFTQPLFLLARRKRSSTGTIFNSLTRQPVDLSIVRLIDKQKDTVVKSMVTGHAGAYFFLPPPGEYRVEVDKQGFAFPSEFLVGESKKELYFGESIAVKTKEQVVDKHVPVDPHEETFSRRSFLFAKWKRRVVIVIAALGPIVSFASIFFDFSYFTAAIFALHIIVLALFIRLHRKRDVKYGIVYDAQKHAVSGATVSLFNKQYDKLIGYYMSDMFGRYFFPAAIGSFTVKVEKTGFATQELSLTIDEKAMKKGFVGKDIYLTPSV